MVAGAVGLLAALTVFVGVVVRIQTGDGCLVVETDDPDVRLIVAQGGKEVEVFDARTKQRVTLPVGDYEIALAGKRPGLGLRSDRFTITRGKDSIVEVRWERAAVVAPVHALPKLGTWNLGPADDLLRGLIPRPAALPGLGRWQMETAAPRDPIDILAWSPNGQRLACAAGGAIREYDVATGQLVRLIVTNTDDIFGMAWLADGRLVAAVWDRRASKVRLWDCLANRLGPTLAADVPASIGRRQIVVVAWSPDGVRVAMASRGRPVEVFATADGKLDRTCSGGQGAVSCLAWSGDSRRLAAGVANGSVRIWNFPGGRVGPVLPEFDGREQGGGLLVLPRLAWTVDGRQLAYAGKDNTIRVWDAATEAFAPSIPSPVGRVAALAWDGGGRRLAAAGLNGHVGVTEPGTARPTTVVEDGQKRGPACVHTLAWDTDGHRLAWGGEGMMIDVWDAGTNARHRTIGSSRQIQAAAGSPDGAHVASACLDGAVRVYAATDGRPGAVLRHTSEVRSLAWAPDARQIATGQQGSPIPIWDSVTGERLRHLDKVMHCFSVAWSPDGRQIVSSTQMYKPTFEQPILLWDATTGKSERIPKQGVANFGYPVQFAWNPDGRSLAWIAGGRAWLWPAIDGDRAGPAKEIVPSAVTLAWRPDGRRLAVVSEDRKKFRIWDRETDRWTDGGSFLDTTGSLAWSPDGQLLAAPQARSVTVIDASNGRTERTLAGPHHQVDAVDWTGGRLVSSGADTLVCQWDTAGDQPRWIAVALPGGTSAVFTPAGELLYADPSAEAELVFLVEAANGSLESLTPAAFRRRVEAASKKR